jgi:hypothetical protein
MSDPVHNPKRAGLIIFSYSGNKPELSGKVLCITVVVAERLFILCAEDKWRELDTLI